MDTLPTSLTMREQDKHLSEAYTRERGRLKQFIRKRVPDAGDAEDILQEVFFEFTRAVRISIPIDQMTDWMYRVALNRITDLFRKKKPDLLADLAATDNEEDHSLLELLPAVSPDPEQMYMRSVMLEALYAALDGLPDEQREVFLSHEIEGKSFKEIADESGVPLNTLLSRKRYATLFLRERLQEIYQEFFSQKG